MEAFSCHESVVFAEKVNLLALARSVPTPFYLYSTQAIQENYRAITRYFPPPRFQLHYAVKANSNLSILSLLRQEGASVEVVSGGELKRALAAGFSPSQIIFTGVGKTSQELDLALSSSVEIIIESLEEASFLAQKAQERGLFTSVLLRLNPDVHSETNPKIATGHASSKFGLSAEEILSLTSNWSPFLDLKGISMHIGSQIFTLSPFEQAYAKLKNLLILLHDQGYAIRKIDLGGGYGVEMGHSLFENSQSFDFKALYSLVRSYFSDFEGQIILEPGRSLVASAGLLIAQVLYRKKVGDQVFLIIDAGMNDFMRPALYGAQHPLIPLQKTSSDFPFERVDVMGPICESTDCFARQLLLPFLQKGDFLAVTYAGAYGASLSHTYNSRNLIEEVLITGENSKTIRSPVTIEEQMSWEMLRE